MAPAAPTDDTASSSSPSLFRCCPANTHLPNAMAAPVGKKALDVQEYPIEGLSVGGQETCVMFPTLNLAFDIGRCPHRAIFQEFVFISHGHMDHIGGLPMYVARRGLYKMKPPTIFVPPPIKENVEKLFEVYRAMDKTELKHNLVALHVGEEFELTKNLRVRAFRTYHAVPSQGYVIYSMRQKLKLEYAGLSGNEIKHLRFSGVDVTCTVASPEIAFTGDTTTDFIRDPDNKDVLKAHVLIMETTFIDESMTIKDARECGHTHLSEIASYAHKLENKAIVLIHFSARYDSDVSDGRFLMGMLHKNGNREGKVSLYYNHYSTSVYKRL